MEEARPQTQTEYTIELLGDYMSNLAKTRKLLHRVKAAIEHLEKQLYDNSKANLHEVSLAALEKIKSSIQPEDIEYFGI